MTAVADRRFTTDEAGIPRIVAASTPFTIVWMFAAIVLSLLIISNLSLGMLSSVRAFVGGESLWSKAQKDAVFHLQNYAADHNASEITRFREDIDIPLGDHEARLEMDKPTPELQVVRQAFLRGGIHADDIDGMVSLYRRLKWVSYMQRAIVAWEAADQGIARLEQAGEALQREVESPVPHPVEIQRLLKEISTINEQLTPIEIEFVNALSDASRMTYQSLQLILLAATPVLLALGIALSIRILQQKQRADDRLRYIAFHDDLTSLPNRLMFNQRLEQALSRHRRVGTQLAVLLMDLDRFKVINDSLGHEVGDILLREVAVRLAAESRHSDSVARMGGDEFVVLIENNTTLADISGCARRLIGQMSAPYLLNGKEYHVTLSIGISVFPADGSDPHSLLKAADVAMYRAKEMGRNNYQYYLPSMNVHTLERLELESDLSHALERNEFLLYYQPKVDVSTGFISGIEALLRWNHPTRGLIPPVDFIPLAEETGLIVEIGAWVLSTACARCKAWQDHGAETLTLAVNLSARQVAEPMLPRDLERIIRASGLDPSTLELEITESVVMAKGEYAVEMLHKFKAIGVQIAIDDFGTGYSALAYLKRFPIDTLKVDRSFIKDIPKDSGDMKIMSAIIAMARGLRLKVVAEGVETPEQLAFLRAEHCDAVQGYLLYRPLAESDVARVLEQNRQDCAKRQSRATAMQIA
jgi:diguanylate cyclase (GGDEF)-like protein